jgi:hypothetical protein
MPAPLPCQFYTPKEYKEYVADQSQCFDNVHAKLGSGITPLNVCAALVAHAEEPIYCRTDHHWQPLGAYYAAEAFASAAGVPFADIGSYTSKKIENSMGTMYAWSKSADLLSDPEDFTYYLPGVPYSAVYYNQDFSFAWDDDDLFGAEIPEDPYVVYLGSDQYIVKVTTEVQNGRKLLEEYLPQVIENTNPEIAEEYGITAVPTIHFYKDGKLVDSHVGVMQPQAVKDVIAQYMYA